MREKGEVGNLWMRGVRTGYRVVLEISVVSFLFLLSTIWGLCWTRGGRQWQCNEVTIQWRICAWLETVFGGTQRLDYFVAAVASCCASRYHHNP